MNATTEPVFECRCVRCGAEGTRFATDGICSRCGSTMLPRRDMVHTYGEYRIFFDPPPIPSRQHDWEWFHRDFDGAVDSGDTRCGTASSVQEAVAMIEEIKPTLSERGE